MKSKIIAIIVVLTFVLSSSLVVTGDDILGEGTEKNDIFHLEDVIESGQKTSEYWVAGQVTENDDNTYDVLLRNNGDGKTTGTLELSGDCAENANKIEFDNTFNIPEDCGVKIFNNNVYFTDLTVAGELSTEENCNGMLINSEEMSYLHVMNSNVSVNVKTERCDFWVKHYGDDEPDDHLESNSREIKIDAEIQIAEMTCTLNVSTTPGREVWSEYQTSIAMDGTVNVTGGHANHINFKTALGIKTQGKFEVGTINYERVWRKTPWGPYTDAWGVNTNTVFENVNLAFDDKNVVFTGKISNKDVSKNENGYIKYYKNDSDPDCEYIDHPAIKFADAEIANVDLNFEKYEGNLYFQSKTGKVDYATDNTTLFTLPETTKIASATDEPIYVNINYCTAADPTPINLDGQVDKNGKIGYKVEINGDEGVQDLSKKDLFLGKNETFNLSSINVTCKDNYEFKGWYYKDSAGKLTKIPDPENFTAEYNMTIYAVTEKITPIDPDPVPEQKGSIDVLTVIMTLMMVMIIGTIGTIILTGSKK